MTLGDLLFQISDLANIASPVCDEFWLGILKTLPYKFKSKGWTVEVARRTLTKYMNSLGFYRGSSKRYQNLDDCPDGWPDSVTHPTDIGIKKINKIIEALLKHDGVHHVDLIT